MKFRPCIDIHNGQVKQIVGGSLSDDKGASENFVSALDGSYYGELYRKYGLNGGHIILLNKYGTPEYDADIGKGSGREGLPASGLYGSSAGHCGSLVHR